MNERTKLGFRAIEAALLLGVLGDGLLRAEPWGLNVPLWTGALAIALVVLLARRRRSVLANGGHWLLLTALLFASSIAWRDSKTLNVLAVFCVITALASLAWRATTDRTWLTGIAKYVLGTITVGINTFFIGFALLLREVRWKEMPKAGWMKNAKSIVLGVIIALPLLIIFGSLFVSADAGFEHMVQRMFSTHEDIPGHILLTLILAWVSGGFLHGIVFAPELKAANDGEGPSGAFILGGGPDAETSGVNAAPQTSARSPRVIGIVEIGTTLGLLNLLFLTFVLLQLRYLFGGAALVQASDTLTYAEYYRRGFFELVTAATLVVPILLGAHWMLGDSNAKHQRIFRLLAGLQVVLVLVIMVSAVRRMLLYQSEYGLTELRLYTTAFMAWLGLVFIWFSLTVLRGRRDRFACGALVAGFLIIAALHVVNPDALIVRVNVAHARAGRRFDVNYAASLSADGLPALMDALPSLNADDRRRIIEMKVLAAAAVHQREDWRTWNWSRARARNVVLRNVNLLREVIDSPRDR
ncbi:MAG: hypothetical protein QOJ64_953 [Acidobacteriota bacterium]|nr:hypothetical protein [Acidobacteriota bacterium]